MECTERWELEELGIDTMELEEPHVGKLGFQPQAVVRGPRDHMERLDSILAGQHL